MRSPIDSVLIGFLQVSVVKQCVILQTQQLTVDCYQTRARAKSSNSNIIPILHRYKLEKNFSKGHHNGKIIEVKDVKHFRCHTDMRRF